MTLRDPAFDDGAFAHAREEHDERDGFECRRTTIPIATRHGLARFHDALATPPSILAALAREPGGLAIERAVFFDVETTGFGGDDTLVFLVGTATLSPAAVEIEQWLLTDEAKEREFLDVVRPRLLQAESLVTFVGKSFDRHRLDDRFALFQGERPLAKLRHADLYHASRRLFRRRVGDTRLATLEREILGIVRRHDLRGSDCPEAWLDFLETRNRRFIEPVLRHNALDLVAMIVLLSKLRVCLAYPDDLEEAAAAGAFFVAAGRIDLATAPLSRVLRAPISSSETIEDARRLGTRVLETKEARD